MPLWDYKCPACHLKKVDIFVHSFDDKVKCPRCRAPMSRLFPVDSRFKPKIFPAEGIFLEHVSAEGKMFYSEKEMRQYEKDNNVELGALL